MDVSKKKIQELIDKYNANWIDPAELIVLEKLIEAGVLDIRALKDLKQLEDRLFEMQDPSPSLHLDDSFYEMLANEKKSFKKVSWTNFFKWPELIPKFAWTSVAMVTGLIVGLLINSPRQENEVTMLTQEVSNLKEMVMLSMLEKESATERLRAVNLTESMNDVSSKVTNALLQVLNNDQNVNVRLAALDALYPYVKDEHVRTALVHSIAKQKSPLVQVSLAELMVMIQEKTSVKELQKVLQNEETPKEVKKKIKESIQVLI